MKSKTAKVLAVAAALVLTSAALAQDTTNTTFFGFDFGSLDFTSWLQELGGSLGPIAAIIWFILFAAWGGFRWLY